MLVEEDGMLAAEAAPGTHARRHARVMPCPAKHTQQHPFALGPPAAPYFVVHSAGEGTHVVEEHQWLDAVASIVLGRSEVCDVVEATDG